MIFFLQKMWYFPLTPQLLALYKSPTLAKLMTWYKKQRSDDGVMRMPSDSEAWLWAEEHWAKLNEEERSVFLAVALDGVNPYGHNSASHSTWPILIIVYNLPTNLAIKKSHIILNTIVPGNVITHNLINFKLCLSSILQY